MKIKINKDKKEEWVGCCVYQMGVLEIVDDPDVVELDVEVLVNALEDTADLDVVLELDGHLVVDEGLEETGEVIIVSRRPPLCLACLLSSLPVMWEPVRAAKGNLELPNRITCFCCCRL